MEQWVGLPALRTLRKPFSGYVSHSPVVPYRAFPFHLCLFSHYLMRPLCHRGITCKCKTHPPVLRIKSNRGRTNGRLSPCLLLPWLRSLWSFCAAPVLTRHSVQTSPSECISSPAVTRLVLCHLLTDVSLDHPIQHDCSSLTSLLSCFPFTYF